MSSPSPVPQGGTYDVPSPRVSVPSPDVSAHSPEYNPTDQTFDVYVPPEANHQRAMSLGFLLLANQQHQMAMQEQQQSDIQELLAGVTNHRKDSERRHEENLTAHNATKMATEEAVQQARRLTGCLEELNAEAQEAQEVIEEDESTQQARRDEALDEMRQAMRQEHQVRSSEERAKLAMATKRQERVRSHDCAFPCLT